MKQKDNQKFKEVVSIYNKAFSKLKDPEDRQYLFESFTNIMDNYFPDKKPDTIYDYFLTSSLLFKTRFVTYDHS